VLEAFGNALRIKELRTKLLITAGLLAVCRVGVFIPVPGVNFNWIKGFIERSAGGEPGGLASFLNLADMFTGGGLFRASIFALGIMPYISASIIFQLLTAVVPALEKMAKEGESGRRRLNQYMRYSTVMLCVIQAGFYCSWLAGAGGVIEGMGRAQFQFLASLSMTVGTVLLMWLGEQIDEFGIGSGTSLIIQFNILSRLPAALKQLWTRFDWSLGEMNPNNIGPEKLVLLFALFVFMVVSVIIITQAQRRVPMNYARRTMTGFSARQYLPLRVNMSGVISIIFAQSIMILPGFLRYARLEFLKQVADHFARGAFFYIITYMVMIVFFSYFYTAVVFNPVEHAENFKQYGAFIPGIRPGRKTAEYLERIMNRITLAGAVFLAFIAIVPQVISGTMGVDPNITDFFGGTGLLIVVGVALDVVQRIESHMMMQAYEGFMKGGGRIRGRR